MSAPDSLDRRAGRGAVWNLAGYGGGQVIRMASNLLLTRLLVPEHFGLRLIINTVLLGVNLLTDIGLGHSVVQSPRGDEPAFRRTAWTVQAARGVVMWLGIWALAPLLAGVYAEPELRVLLPVAGLSALFQGLWSTRMAGYRRALRLEALTALQIGEQLLAALVMAVWAWHSPTVWALVAGGVASSFVVMLASHGLLEGPRDGPQLEARAARELLRFGFWIFLSTAIMYVVNYADRLVVSKLTGLAVAGVYGIALMITLVPCTALGAFSTNVAFPLFSQVHRDGGGLPEVFRRVRAPVNAVAGWLIAVLLGAGPLGVRTLWTEPYWDAGWMLQILVVGAWPGVILVSSNNAGLLALGHSRLTAGTSAAKGVAMLVLVPAGYAWLGLPGLLLGFSLSEWLRYAASTAFAVRHELRDVRSDLVLTAVVAASGAGGHALASALVGAGLPTAVAGLAVVGAISLARLPWLLPIAARLRAGRSPFESLEPEAAALDPDSA